MVSCSRFILITNSSDHRRVLNPDLLHTIIYCILVAEWIASQSLSPVVRDRFRGGEDMNSLLLVLWPSRLGNYFLCKRFAFQILLWSLEFVIKINLEHDTIAIWNFLSKFKYLNWLWLFFSNSCILTYTYHLTLCILTYTYHLTFCILTYTYHFTFCE